MILSLQVLALMALIVGSTPVPPDECPRAILACHQSSSGRAAYECGVAANNPSKRNAPQYTWAVSEGRILGDPKSPNVMVDVSGVESEKVTVTAEVHWKRTPQVCDAHMTERIKLR